MKDLLITFSGGRTSAFMARLLMEHPDYADYNKVVVFANTGKEDEATLEFVHRCDVEWGLNVTWIEGIATLGKWKGTTVSVVDFETASRKGEPFELVVEKYGIPSKMYRSCTRELKERPMHKFAKSIFGHVNYLTAIGIRSDEQHRVGSRPNFIYPLVDLNVTEEFIRSWWDRQDFDLKLKDYQGNCDLCFLKSIRKRVTILSEDPAISHWWARMEEKYPREDREIFDIYRKLSIKDLLDMTEKDFNPSVDLHEERKGKKIEYDGDLDLEFDCFCKST